MIEIFASKNKSDMALQTQSTKDRKSKRKWNGNKGRGGYNNSYAISYQQEGSSSK